MKNNLTKIPLREAWPNEAYDFTPYLAKRIDDLGQKIGMDLKVEGVEVNAGGYFVDILAKDNKDGKIVIIENQLARADHKHLGQILLYCAHFDAHKIVWIARSFKPAQHNALLALQTNGVIDEFHLICLSAYRDERGNIYPHYCSPENIQGEPDMPDIVSIEVSKTMNSPHCKSSFWFWLKQKFCIKSKKTKNPINRDKINKVDGAKDCFEEASSGSSEIVKNEGKSLEEWIQEKPIATALLFELLNLMRTIKEFENISLISRKSHIDTSQGNFIKIQPKSGYLYFSANEFQDKNHIIERAKKTGIYEDDNRAKKHRHRIYLRHKNAVKDNESLLREILSEAYYDMLNN